MRSRTDLSINLFCFALSALHACGDTAISPNPSDTTTPPGDTTTPPGDTTTPPGDTTTVGPCGGCNEAYSYCMEETNECTLKIVGGEPCESANTCFSGSCNENATCACNTDDPMSCQNAMAQYCDASGVCTQRKAAGATCAQSYECANNNCTAGGVCGCVDGDCAASEYCSADAACVAKKDADEGCASAKECKSDSCNNGKCGCNNDVSCPSVLICDGGSCDTPGVQASGDCDICADEQYCIPQPGVYGPLGLNYCNDKRAAGEDCSHNGLCTSGICDKSGEGEEIEVEFGGITVSLEIGSCGCLVDSDCSSNNCNEDTNQCVSVAAQNECTSCDPSIEGICGDNTCYTTGSSSACVNFDSKDYGETCCKTAQCKGGMKCVNHGSGKKCYKGYGQACDIPNLPSNGDGYCFLDILKVDEGEGATVCFPFVERCNPAPCVPGANLCGVHSCNPIGPLEIQYYSWQLSLAADFAQNVLGWEEGDVIDIAQDFTTGDIAIDSMVNQFVDGYACINPGTVPENGWCIGTNHCQQGLTCKGIPFESKCKP